VESRVDLAGGAAGIAAAFGAPIGGVLYVFEEISSYWDERKTVLACLATAVAVMISRGFGFFAFGESAHFESLVVFRKRHSKVDGKRFTWLDLPFFVVVAIVGGLQAALVTRMMLWWTRTRAKWAQPGGWRFRRRARVAEAVALSIVISVVFYAICLLGYCKKKPQDHDDDENGVVDCPPTWAPSASGGRRLSGAVRHHRLYNCDKRGEHGEYNDLASLLLVGAEGAIKNLLTRDQDTPFRMRSLAIALPVYFLGFTSMAGTSLPMGTFVPNLLLGALAGRLLGSAFGDLVGRGLSGPGLYALMGAGAQLGGFTRVALTVTALMTEATGDVGAIAPLMLCCIIGAGVASVVTEPYDEVLLHMRRIPYLDDKDLDPECKRITAGALCARSSRLADISSVEDVAAALADDKHKSLDHFLVVGEGGRHIGVVRRRRLVRKLKGDAAASAVPDKKDGDLKRALQEAATHAHEVKEMAKKAAPKLLRFGSEMDAHDSDRRKDEESPHDRPETCRRGDDVGDSIEDAGAVDCAALVEANGPYVAREDQTMDEIFPLFHRLQLEVVVVVGLTGKAIGILERVHLVSLSLEHIERLARQAGETDAVKAETARKLQSLRKISARSLEIRAGILGYHIEGGAQGSRRSRTRSHGDLTETCPDLGECTAPEFARSSAPPRRRSMPTRLSPPPPVRGLSAGV